MKKYSYNADFFGRWFEKSGVKLTQLMNDLRVNNVSLKRWMKDKSNPLPVEKMVLLCNLYDIDLSEFFLDGDSSADIQPKSPEQQKSLYAAASAHHQQKEKNVDAHAAQLEILRMRLEHMQEIQRMKEEWQMKEEHIRKEHQERENEIRRQYEERISQYEIRIDEYKEMVRDGMQTTRLALTQGRRQSSYGGYGSDGVVDFGDAPRPHVNPNKR